MKTREDFGQMVLDTRPDLDRAIEAVAGEAISTALALKAGVITLLGTLSDPNYNAIDATSSIVNSITDATGVLIRAAAEMKRTLDDLYTAEMNASPGKTPMEALADGDGFQEAEDLAPEDPDLDPDTDPDAEPGDNETEE